MAKLLGLTRVFGDWAESPREVTRTIPTSESVGESGWLIRFFDSAFFCEWIAVSYLYKHDHAGVRDYLCNRMYSLPLSGIESYLFQICYMCIHKPCPALDRFVIDICSKSLKISLKVHWFFMAELEEMDDNDGISRIQEKCQVAATLRGEWPLLVKTQSRGTNYVSLNMVSNSCNGSSSSTSRNQMLNKLLSSKQKFWSMTSSSPSSALQPLPLSVSPPSSNIVVLDDCGKVGGSSEDGNKIFKKLIPSPKMRDALLFRKSVDKEDEDSEKDSGFFKKLLRDSRDDEMRKPVDKGKENDEEPEREGGFFKRFMRDSRDEDMRKSVGNSKEKDEVPEKENGFLKRLLRDSRDEDLRRPLDKEKQSMGDLEKEDGFFRRFLRDNREEEIRKSMAKSKENDVEADNVGFIKRLIRENRDEIVRSSLDKEKQNVEDHEKEDGIFRRLFRDDGDEEAKNSMTKTMEKDDEADKGGLDIRLTKENQDEDVRKSTKELEKGFFKRFMRDKREDDLRKSIEKQKNGEEHERDGGFLKRLFSTNRDDEARPSMRKDDEEFDKYGSSNRYPNSRDEEEEFSLNPDRFFKRLFRDSKNNSEERCSNVVEDDEKSGFFKKLFKEKFDDRKDGRMRNDDAQKVEKISGDDDKDGFFRKLFKERTDDKKDSTSSNDHDRKSNMKCEDEESSELSMFRRMFRVHPEDSRTGNETNQQNTNLHESSPGTEKFFWKLFKDRERSFEDSELYNSKKSKMICPGSPKQQSENSTGKPPLPDSATVLRKGVYNESLDFVQSLCETSFNLVDVCPVEDRKMALCETLVEINARIDDAQSSGGVCFPMGKGSYRVLHIPEDEAVLLNSREKAPYLICVEVLKCEAPSNSKDASNSRKLSKGGIPLANGDALLPKPPPWAYPLWSRQNMYQNGYDRPPSATSESIDQAVAEWNAKVKFVRVNLCVEGEADQPNFGRTREVGCTCKLTDSYGTGWVKVVLSAEPGIVWDDVVEQDPPHQKEHRRVPSTVAIEEVKAAALKGEAPPGLPLKGAGQGSSDAQSQVEKSGVSNVKDALAGELWEQKKLRIQKASAYGNLPGWDLRSVIVKSGDDCRQEHLAVQLISHFYDIFQEAGLPLWLRPYEVLVTSSYTALIETIPDTASIHSIKTRFPGISSLREFFVAKYQENSQAFKHAQRNFVESMAGYSLVCYLLQVKDRHNGNLLLDEDGHIIHIDFGFMLSNSPGGVNFESAPFKLTRELLEVMDSDAEGVQSEFFDYFKVLCIQGFLTCRKHAERIILLVEMLQNSGFPCFKGGPRTIQNLRKRFQLSLTEEQCVSLVLSLISSSLDSWRTRQYDYYQRVLNGIL